MHVKEWEIDGLRRLADRLSDAGAAYDSLHFYYSFQIPKLGKEFDLLQIGADRIVNIELKSEAVSDEKIRKQLLLNKHYLASLGKDVYSFTFISGTGRLVRLTGSEKLAEADFSEIKARLTPEKECCMEEIEQLFGEDKYLISPLEDPDKFLRRDYFLTSQQKDIKGKILRAISERKSLIQGFTGLPGTGKSLLLFDLAMWLSDRDRGCVLHCGKVSEQMRRLDTLLKRIDFLCAGEVLAAEDFGPQLEGYSFLCVDEGHRLTEQELRRILDFSKSRKIPVILSYDCEDDIHVLERGNDISTVLAQEPEFMKYQLTNRIRTNARMSNFIRNLVHISGNQKKNVYDCVSVSYAENEAQRDIFTEDYLKKGYCCPDADNGKEYDKVVMVLDEAFYYSADGYLRCHREKAVSALFHGLNRAKTELALVVVNNGPVFGRIIQNLQGGDE